ncbi:trans-resveratrol di-O-methyltransferase-like [Ziziphus jujuba]|uniref:Trans-resveratrol di-O-methyltransferase-like n=1 Tax=Ziziphus jujuba TaxID=326968 RepID=A0ABM3ZZX0_ZIZJJ|nr:trans-resveratrol di-O-methyltransferase-like [Ziziphus jujuba]
MDSGDELSSTKLLQAQALIWNVSFNYMKPMSLKCAIELGIPDIIHNHGQAITLSELIQSLHIHPSKTYCIYRLMRLLVHSGFFANHKGDDKAQQEEKYSLTPASRLLLKDEPFRATQVFLNSFVPEFVTPCLHLSAWLQNTDETPFETVYERTIWDFLAENPDHKQKFYEEMVSDSLLIGKAVMEECKEVFEGLKTLVDVGGGTGTMAKAIVKMFPSIKCAVFDLPHVVAGLHGTENLHFIGGNMFEAIPPANALLLKWVLHDWKDEECVAILKKCREAIPSKKEGGKIIIVELIIDDPKTDKELSETQLCFDMFMLTGGGKERSQMEWEKLFLAAGFSDYKITPLLGVRSLIEVFP